MNDLEQAFNSFFRESETNVDFSVNSDGHLYEFDRIEHPEQTSFEFTPPPDGFLSFEEFLHKYSIWGNRTVEFRLTIDGELCVEYINSPENLMFPILLKHVSDADKKVGDTTVYFRKSAKKVLKEVEDEMIHVLANGFLQATGQSA